MRKEDKILYYGVCTMAGLAIFMIALVIFDICTTIIHKEDYKRIEIVNAEDIKIATPSIIYITTETEEETETEEQKTETRYTSLGEYKLTAYCPCEICCGKWSGGNTASGTKPQPKHTIAVDKSILPFGTTVLIDGIEYVSEDTGNFKGKHIDIYFDNHREAVEFGVQRKEVFIKNEIWERKADLQGGR